MILSCILLKKKILPLDPKAPWNEVARLVHDLYFLHCLHTFSLRNFHHFYFRTLASDEFYSALLKLIFLKFPFSWFIHFPALGAMAAQLMLKLRWTYKCNKPFLTFCVFPVLLFIRWFHLLSLKELATGRKSVCQVYEVGRMQGADDKQVSWDAQENETLCASQFQQCLFPGQPQGINLLMLSVPAVGHS